MNETSKIGLVGAGLLTAIGVAVAIGQIAPDVTVTNNTVAAQPVPSISKDLVGWKVLDAVNQLSADGFDLSDSDNLTVEGWTVAANCEAPNSDETLQQFQVVSVTAEGEHITMAVRDTRVCPAPAPIVVPPVPNVGVPNPNLPNRVPRVSSGGGGGGGESRFCRKRWWC